MVMRTERIPMSSEEKRAALKFKGRSIHPSPTASESVRCAHQYLVIKTAFSIVPQLE